MQARIGLIAAGFVGCLCLASGHLAMPERLHAADTLIKQRHSLIARPSAALPDGQAPIALPKNPGTFKPLSLVTPIHPVREGKTPFSIPPIARPTH